jgi:ADP-ribose pyrophosphatase YjhB (NUDIX family)
MTVTRATGPAPTGGTHVRTRTIVAVVVLWRGRVGLFRRSVSVDHDRGMWHCITGYLEPGATPPQQALSELHEETGLGVVDLDSFVEGDILELPDANGRTWTVHTYRAATTRRRLVLNEEHDAHRWVQLRSVVRFGNRVSWLEDVLAAAGVGTRT